jgi:hypothetical protein
MRLAAQAFVPPDLHDQNRAMLVSSSDPEKSNIHHQEQYPSLSAISVIKNICHPERSEAQPSGVEGPEDRLPNNL